MFFLQSCLSRAKEWDENSIQYSRLLITRTLDRSLEPRANSNQNLRHTFTAILPLVTRTLHNSNLPLTRTNFPFPSRHFLYNFTLDNSNHACQDVTAGQNKQYSTVVQNNEFILIEAGFAFFALFCTSNKCQSSSLSSPSTYKCSLLLMLYFALFHVTLRSDS